MTCLYSEDQRERFWARVDIQEPDDCWPWTGTPWSNLPWKNYGQVGFVIGPKGSKCIHKKTHKVAYEIANDTMIPKGVHGLHHCDTPKCCNPLHIFLGDNDMNIADRQAKNRQAKGEGIAAHKLTENDIPLIRALVQHGVTQKEVAKMHNVHNSTISNVITGVTWSWL